MQDGSEINPLFTACDSIEGIQVIVLHPDAYRKAVEDAMRLDPLTQVRMTPNSNLTFLRKGVVFMKGKYSPANINEAQ